MTDFPAEVIERAARAYTESLHGRAYTDAEWAATRSGVEVTAMTDALSAALGDVTVQWSAVYPYGDYDAEHLPGPSDVDGFDTREDCEEETRFTSSEFLVIRRMVTEWRPADE